ncbi:beta-propeller domain-containing protein [uncultured Thiothrix sp.]|uniref:beta-propeller domain-containing protein n=1 Tax=uncultured Thiothrix sp. TaxID=223185 RepID=UPI00261E5FF3|nr:beta-propeller domain-containing protein [uncultured Thiothrix sp.]
MPSSLFAQALDDKQGLLKPISFEQLEQQLKTELKSRIIVNDYRPMPTIQPPSVMAQASPEPRAAQARPSMRARASAGQVSSTNLQEQGVDEADMVKTDGRYLYGANQQGGGIRVFDTQAISGSTLKQITTIGMPANSQLHGLYLIPSKKQLVAVTSSYQSMRPMGMRSRYHAYMGVGQIQVLIFNTSNAVKPQLIRQLDIEGGFFQTRRINNRLYLFLNHYLSGMPGTYKSIETKQPLTEAQKEVEKQKISAAIDQWSVKEFLPNYFEKGNKEAKPLFKNNSLYAVNQKAEAVYQLSSLISLDLDNPSQAPEAIAYFGNVGNFYMSDKAAYLVSPYDALVKVPISSMQGNLVHKFAVSGKSFNYRGSGAFFGTLNWNELSSFQFDEDQRGNLRVVTYNMAQTNKHPDPITRSPVILTVLAEAPKAKQLVTVGRLPNAKYPQAIGKPGERLYGARLFNNYAYFVTFRNTDPLYVVDLRDPRDPKVTGELVIPGFSDYLHPVTPNLLLGVGKVADAQAGGAQQGWKLSLFDISNPNRPQEVDKLELGGSGSNSPANRNHHAITSLAINNNTLTRVALPVMVSDPNTATIKNGLHRFEVTHAQRKLKHLGGFSVNPAKDWYWDENDRSILIDNTVYYFHNGNFYASAWAAK